jgi:DNA-3-methyladenine glycosylase II
MLTTASHSGTLPSIHKHLVAIAKQVAPSLSATLQTLGPVTFPIPSKSSVGFFLARTIIGQQLSTRVARMMWNRVLDTTVSRTMSVPSCFSAASVTELRHCGLSTNKTRALLVLGQAERDGLLNDIYLRGLTHQERTQKLTKLFGVGPWTCDMVSIFYYRCPDVWPEGDATVQKMFKGLIGRRKPSPTASKFVPYRSYLALCMWKLVDSKR